MNIRYLISSMIVFGLSFTTGCVGYAGQPYARYSQPVTTSYYTPRAAPYGGGYGGYSYTPPRPSFGGFGREFEGQRHEFREERHEFGGYGGYRRHDRD